MIIWSVMPLRDYFKKSPRDFRPPYRNPVVFLPLARNNRSGCYLNNFYFDNPQQRGTHLERLKKNNILVIILIFYICESSPTSTTMTRQSLF